jgi:predicted RNA binding protein YcfA (HicA-like mRNA interferase family)
MGKLPLQTPKEIQANLKALGFIFKHQVGSHRQYERPADSTRPRAVVTVDVGKSQFSKNLMKSMIRQSLFSQDEFCTGTPKIPVPVAEPIKEGKR